MSHSTDTRPIRIGMVNYINTAPIYEIWKERDLPKNWRIIEGQPSELNRLLAKGEIDLGFVSSYEYAARPQQYQILADLSISATGPVGSVFLFSALPLEQLDGQQIVLTSQSDTSICLVRILLEECFRVRPRYRVGEVRGPQAELNQAAAVLAIGDDALRINHEGRYPLAIDLGEAWHRFTGLPFVFSVCAVRQDFLDQDSASARRIRAQLLSCRQEGKQRMAEICQQVAQRIPMDCHACTLYLHAIEHDLSAEKIKALEQFFRYLIDRGEAPSHALPLKIFR